jgi:transcriptional regulator with XRE-family HTH domain
MQHLQYFAITINYFVKHLKINYMHLIIKELRESKKVTQDEIVKLSGIKKRTYVDYENGKADIPLSKLQNIAIALDVTIFDLFDQNTIKNSNLVSEPANIYNKKQIDYREKLIETLEIQNLDLRKDKIELQKDKDLLAKIINTINK